MSNLHTRRENELLGGSDYDDLDINYPKIPTKETTVEPPTVAEEEQGPVAEAPRELLEEPRSLALAQVAANAVHAAYEEGYALGFNKGRLAGLDDAIAIVNRKPYVPPKASFPDDGNPF